MRRLQGGIVWTRWRRKGEGEAHMCMLFNNPLNYTDPDGRWPWESKNVKNARSYARANGGSLEKWEGRARIRPGYWGKRTFASVNWTQSGSDGVCEFHAKVFSPEGRSLGGTVADVVKTLDDGGNADPANIGTTTDQDVAVAAGTIGVITGTGILIEGGLGIGGYLLLTVSMANSADDMGTNANGESISQQMVSGEENKEIVGLAKTGVSVMTAGRSIAEGSETLSSPNRIISAINDAISAIRSFSNKNNDENERN